MPSKNDPSCMRPAAALIRTVGDKAECKATRLRQKHSGVASKVMDEVDDKVCDKVMDEVGKARLGIPWDITAKSVASKR